MQKAGISLKDKVVIVTGATKGIGNGIARAMAEAGANVVVVSRSQSDCDKVAAELSQLGAEALAVSADVTKIASIQNVVDQAVNKFGHIDVLVNNAGAVLARKAEDVSEEDWDKVINLDLKGAFFCAQIAGRKMIAQNRGKIINISSMWGLVAFKGFLPYCVAKGGILQMTRALALEWARYDIQVNAICPGYILTALNEAELTDEKIAPGLLRKIPAKRFGDVQDLVGAALYLASDSSNYMTGAHMTIDGGWTIE
ncbi:MAG: glucose 1-dehydrogenase [Negativicutes bacterium]|nr:glucose 1-dehydrogenase [Negativicutes bacterium]